MARILGILSSSVQKSSPAFESIASATGTGSSNTITFSNIPSTYQHLQIRAIVKDANTSTNNLKSLYINFNSDTGTNYSYHRLSGNGTSISANTVGTSANEIILTGLIPESGSNQTDSFAVMIIDIHDYTSASKYKTVRIFAGEDLNRSTAPVGNVMLISGLWQSTSAITSISLGGTNISNFTTTTQFALYGIKG